MWQLLPREEDQEDPHIPLLLWWAVESKAISAQSQTIEMLTTPEAWSAPKAREAILGRLMRRYAAEATDRTLQACIRLMATAPSESDPRPMQHVRPRMP